MHVTWLPRQAPTDPLPIGHADWCPVCWGATPVGDCWQRSHARENPPQSEFVQIAALPFLRLCDSHRLVVQLVAVLTSITMTPRPTGIKSPHFHGDSAALMLQRELIAQLLRQLLSWRARGLHCRRAFEVVSSVVSSAVAQLLSCPRSPLPAAALSPSRATGTLPFVHVTWLSHYEPADPLPIGRADWLSRLAGRHASR